MVIPQGLSNQGGYLRIQKVMEVYRYIQMIGGRVTNIYCGWLRNPTPVGNYWQHNSLYSLKSSWDYNEHLPTGSITHKIVYYLSEGHPWVTHPKNVDWTTILTCTKGKLNKKQMGIQQVVNQIVHEYIYIIIYIYTSPGMGVVHCWAYHLIGTLPEKMVVLYQM